jgi:hypothetical protein
MKVKDLISRLSKFDGELDLILISKQGNDRGYGIAGAELCVLDRMYGKLYKPTEIAHTRNRDWVAVVYGDKE